MTKPRKNSRNFHIFFYQISAGQSFLDIFSFGVGVTVDRYGQIYVSPTISMGKGSKALGVAATANWLEQPNMPNASETYNFLSGVGNSFTAGYHSGGQLSYSPTIYQRAWGVGYVTPGYSFSLSYTPEWLIFNKK